MTILNKKLNTKVIKDLLIKSGNEKFLQISIESFLYGKIQKEQYDKINIETFKLLDEWNLINKSFEDYRLKYIDEDDRDPKELFLKEIKLDMKRRHRLNKKIYNCDGDDRLMILNNLLNTCHNKYF